jgi:lipopolysaccharide transport system ATP-binding protein
LGKMGDAVNSGRTLVFVSHDMATMQKLCNVGIYLKGGVMAYAGSTVTAVELYQKQQDTISAVPVHERRDREGDGKARIVSLRVNGQDAVGVANVLSGDRLLLEIGYRVFEVVPSPVFSASLWDSMGSQLLNMNNRLVGVDMKCADKHGIVICEIPHVPLPAGEYRVNVAIQSGGSNVDKVQTALRLRVGASPYYGTGEAFGKCFVEHEWKHM